ncbi:hypothetical protein SLEP1_g5727 [Rubroshorea leprosula]|uniref:Prenyltransferase alpha-alpha toroid domain-containing protein n=1 Tax=Rubroshorea leprosula TaxID=152421 RepID=A0AAV5I1W3_9ROSI|nr:hypothetical protein SLEP1_g5727 [Rubroshorea leprosula]
MDAAPATATNLYKSDDEDEQGSSPPPSFFSSPPSFLSSPPSSFERDRHVAYLEMMYRELPHHYQTQEINRLTLAYFTISGLHLLQASDRVDSDKVAGWVLSFLAHPSSKAELTNGMKFF